jgi:hypothetical protein
MSSVETTVIDLLRRFEDPYEGFEGNGEACRFCFARRFEGHNDECVWLVAHAYKAPAETAAGGRFLLSAYGRRCFDAGHAAGEAEARTKPTCEQRTEILLSWRNVTDPCETCSGSGVRTYSTTATWRYNCIGGSMCTTDVCDRCWGTGDLHRRGADLRYLYGRIDAETKLVEALEQLRIDANRLCDRNLGGTYEADCRRAIAKADAALAGRAA